MNIIIFDFYNTLFNPKNKKLFRGALPMLNKLKQKFSMILITTGGKERWSQIENLKLIPLFNQIILCKQKSLPLFRGLTGSKTIIIGDRSEAEIFIGKKLNLTTILVNPELENPITTIRKNL